MINHVIKESIKKAIWNLYEIEIPVEQIHIEHPNNLEWGDYATNVALKLSAQLKQSPIDIAKKLSYELNDLEYEVSHDIHKYHIFKKISYANPGFINFSMSDSWLQYVLYEIIANEHSYGSGEIFKDVGVALEHSNVNPNKAAHIGHLRNACIGQFIERVYEKLGGDIEVQYFDNDLGVQVTTSLMGTKHITQISPEDYDKFDHYAWDVYSKMESLIEKSEDLKKEREELMKRLEDENDAVSKEQEELSKKILVEQLRTFKQLGFDYDVVIRERDIVSLGIWDEAFEILKKNENVYFAESGSSKGCWLVKMSKNGDNENTENKAVEEDKIIVRSNGVPTYTGKDIAYHMWKFGLLKKDFYYEKLDVKTQDKPLWITTSNAKSDSQNDNNLTFSGVDKVINVIDVKQTYAMESVKNSLMYLGYVNQAENMHHVNYGFVYLSPNTAEKLGIDISYGKSQYGMSGRKGWGIKIDDFIQIVDNKIMDEHGDFATREVVRNGAIKFEMLKYNTFQDLVFDMDSALNLVGFTGPYIQYTHARANSVLSKSGYMFDEHNFMLLVEEMEGKLADKEIDILRLIYQFTEIIEKSALEFSPNLLCTFLFDLSQKYNSFYNDLPILMADTEELKKFRLTLTHAVKIVINNGLYLLGIDAPDKM